MRTADYIQLGHKQNKHTHILELKIQPIIKFMQYYRTNMKQHERIVENKRIPKHITSYKPRGAKRLEPTGGTA
jgi:hypothetical protein